jgi:CheY-like chemotaxis protein
LGIAPHEISTLFDAFVQTSAGIRTAEGTGLGLAITQKFVQMLGGEIAVESVVGEGTTFRFNIKLTEVDSSEALMPHRRRVVGLVPGQERYRILVVDDTKTNRLLLIKLLEPCGFEVREAANGLEGINIWESWQPHLIWIDTRMPVIGGVEAIKQIRAKEREREIGGSFCPATIIITLTASLFEERRGEILAAGSNDFVRKPVSEEVIFEKIRQHLGVLYCYEDFPQVTTAPRESQGLGKPDAFFIEELARLPITLVTELYEAANKLREDSVFELIERISETSVPLAIALRDLANDFHLDRIVHLTETVINLLGHSS